MIKTAIGVKNLLDKMTECCPVKAYTNIGYTTDRQGVSLMWRWYIGEHEYYQTTIVKPNSDINEALAYSKHAIKEIINNAIPPGDD